VASGEHAEQVVQQHDGWVGYCTACRVETVPHTTALGAWVALWIHRNEKRNAAARRPAPR